MGIKYAVSKHQHQDAYWLCLSALTNCTLCYNVIHWYSLTTTKWRVCLHCESTKLNVVQLNAAGAEHVISVVQMSSSLHVLRAVLKHVPPRNMFQIGMVCRSKKCAFLKHVSVWHRANFVISKMAICLFLTITFEVALLLLLKNKETNKQMQPGLTFGLFSLIFMLQDHAFIMWLWYDEVCTVLIWTCFRNAHFSKRHTMPIWNIFWDGTCFRTARNTRTLDYLYVWMKKGLTIPAYWVMINVQLCINILHW